MAGMILTNNGQELLTQALLGRTLSFTKVKIGEGILSGQTEKELTELISPYKEIDITSIAKVGEGLTRIRVAFSNEGFPRVVNFREVGVFAKINDEVEVLYSYENYGDAVESIPADDGVNIVEKIIDTINYVDDADNVTAIIDKSAVYATMVDLEEAQSTLGTGISELNESKLEKGNFWGTAEDLILFAREKFHDDLVGTIFYKASNTLGYRELRLNGTLLNREVYPKLWAYVQASGKIVYDEIWQSDDSKKGMFSTGDGNTTFRIPEIRGEFIRAWDDGRGVDYERQLGSWQPDIIQNHIHWGGAEPTWSSVGYMNNAESDAGNSGYRRALYYKNGYNEPVGIGANSDGITAIRKGNETRGRNNAYLAVIKY